MFRPTILATALLLASQAAQATGVTLSYEGVVTASPSGTFQVGDRIHITYTVETSATDVQPATDAGVFFTGLASLSVSLPDSGFNGSTGVGLVQTFNDTADGDQVFLISNNIVQASPVGGAQVTQMEVDFLDSGTDGQPPAMISSDAVPTEPLLSQYGYFAVETSGGRGYLQFVAAPVDDATVAELVDHGNAQVAALVDDGSLRAGVGTALSAKLNELLASYNEDDTVGACLSLDAFRNQVNNLVKARKLDAADASALLSTADELDSLLGC